MKYLNAPGSNALAETWRSSYPPAVPITQSVEGSELNLVKYLTVLRKNLWLIVGIVLCSTLIAALITVRSPKRYDAVAKINVERETPQILNFKEFLQDSGDYDMYVETQIRILQSNALALKAIQDLRLASDPGFLGYQAKAENSSASRPWSEREEYGLINQLLGSLRVVRVRGSQIVEIHFMAFEPRLAARVANKLAENFIEHNLKDKYEATMQASTWLASQLEDLKRKVEKSEEELVNYERANQIVLIEPKTDRSAADERLKELNHQLLVAAEERSTAEARWHIVQQQGAAALKAFANDFATSNLQGKIDDIAQHLAESQLQYGENHPKYLKLKAQMDQLQKDLEREQRLLFGQVESQYRLAAAKEQEARRAFEQTKAEVESQNDKSIHYNILKREVDGNRDLYNGLLQRLKEAGVSAGLRSSNIRMIDAARPPLAPSLPKTGQNISLGVIVGVLIGLVGAFLREYLDNTVKTPDDVEQFAGLPNLGVIPGISPGLIRAAYYTGYGKGVSRAKQLRAAEESAAKEGPREICLPETVSLSHPHSSVAESFRALGTALLLTNSGMPPRTILVTSGLPSEGKTTIAINVAITLAHRGGRVLLLDGDLRRPSVSQQFYRKKNGREETAGLSHYLTGNAKIEEVVRPSVAIPNLDLLCAGSIPPNPAELCSSEGMRQLLQRLREDYSHVIIDSPPLLSVTDATILSVQTDGVLLVSRSGFSTRDSLRRSKQLLGNVNARLLGVVLNDLNLAVDGYYYYYYYGYYGYGRGEKEVRNAVGS